MNRGTGHGRLEAVASLVPPGARVAEIGTDHGRLPELLLRSGRVAECIGTERTERLLARARGRLERAALAERVTLRAGDGLEPLQRADRIEVLVLAGLGARTIRAVLGRRDPRDLGVRRLVLQPQSEPALLRRWLWDHDWRIVEERIVEERGRYYEIIGAERGAPRTLPPDPALHPADLLAAGPRLLESADPLLRRVWSERLATIERALHAASAPGPRGRLRQRREQARRILAFLERRAAAL